MSREQRDPFENTTQDEAAEIARGLLDPETYLKDDNATGQVLFTKLDTLFSGRVFSYVLESHANIKDASKPLYVWKFGACVKTQLIDPAPPVPVLNPDLPTA